LAIKLALVMGRRSSEVVEAPWAEFDLERAEPRWTLPDARSKSGHKFVLAVAPWAHSLIMELQRLCNGSPFLLPSARGLDRPSDEGLMRRAINRMFDEKLLTCPGFTPHDFRRTMTNRMEDELGIAPHIVDAALGHYDGSVRSRHYSQANRLTELRAAFVAYEQHLAEVLGLPAVLGAAAE
jgi:integrase